IWPKPIWIALYPSVSAVRICVITLVLASTTVTGMTRLSSSHTCVMPTLRPIRPRAVAREFVLMTVPSKLDFDVDAGGQVEAHQRVDRLRRRIHNVDKPLMCAHLEMLAAVLVFMR